MQAVDEFKPSTTEPVFGSGLLQAKVAQQVNNEAKESEQAHPPSEPVVNGQADAALIKTPAIETPANGTSESNQENTSVHASSAAHLNGKVEQPSVETKPAADNEVKQAEVSTSVSKPTEKPVQDEPPTRVTESHAPPAAEPASTPTVNEGSSSTTTTAKDETAPIAHVETTIADPPAEPDTPGPKSKVGSN